jgi:protein SCO1/2
VTRFLLLLMLLASPALALDPFRDAGIDRRADGAVPMDIPFREADGTLTTLRRIAEGRPILLAPVQHDCPNLCGLTLAGLVQAIGAQAFAAGRDFAVVAFGIDPKEGPAAAQAAVDRLGAPFPIHALTGAETDIAAVTDGLGYRFAWDPALAQYAHVAAVAVLTPDGRLARWLYGVAPAPTDLSLALTEAGEGTVGDWADQLLLLCYHYDPETGRYGPLVWTLLRLGGGLTVAAAGAFMLLALRRERRR